MKMKPTKCDETRHCGLSGPQQRAVDLLAGGMTVTDTAEAVGVTRQTASEWLNNHPEFQAALNRRRAELWDATADKLRSLATKAADRLERELDGDGPGGLRAAELVLKSVGLLADLRPTGKTDAGEIETDRREADGWKSLTRDLMKAG